MDTFYSIIYCPIRSVADERVSIGLLLRSNNQIYFRYSRDKLKIIRALLPDSSYRLLNAYLRNFESYFQKRQGHNEADNMFGNNGAELPDYVNPSYINYLNTYGHNLVHFSKPSNLSIEANENVYNMLYHKFVYDSDQIIEHDITIYEKVRNQVNPTIKKHVNIDLELTSNDVENLVVPTKVWFIGQNEVEVTGEVFDFEKMIYHLEHEITKHLNLINTLQKGLHHGESTHFVVGKEPVRNNRVNHMIWNNIRKLDYVHYVPYNELEVINEYMKLHQVAPYKALTWTDDNNTIDDVPF